MAMMVDGDSDDSDGDDGDDGDDNLQQILL